MTMIKRDISMLKELDVALLYIGGFPNSFVRIDYITPDEQKKDWWNVVFTKLGMPCDTFVWKLHTDNLAFSPWTLDGVEMYFQLLPLPDVGLFDAPDKKVSNAPNGALESEEKVKKAKVTSISNWAKKI